MNIDILNAYCGLGSLPWPRLSECRLKQHSHRPAASRTRQVRIGVSWYQVVRSHPFSSVGCTRARGPRPPRDIRLFLSASLACQPVPRRSVCLPGFTDLSTAPSSLAGKERASGLRGFFREPVRADAVQTLAAAAQEARDKGKEERWPLHLRSRVAPAARLTERSSLSPQF